MSSATRPLPLEMYAASKREAPDSLALIRVGDFYELFHDDAKVAARCLGLTITSRSKAADSCPMAGFPYHQLDRYLMNLVASGHRVAVLEYVP